MDKLSKKGTQHVITEVLATMDPQDTASILKNRHKISEAHQHEVAEIVIRHSLEMVGYRKVPYQYEYKDGHEFMALEQARECAVTEQQERINRIIEDAKRLEDL